MIRPCFGVLLLICLAESTDYRKCYHIQKRKELRCHGKNLGAVPENLPADLVKLEIKNDDLSSGFEFPELTSLRKLYLTNVNIGNEFPKLAFAKLKNLQDLRIQYLPGAEQNHTVTVHPEAFHMLRRLFVVRLINLGIRELPEYMFKDSTQLRYIYILGMTIDTIRSNTFAPLERVQLLNLADNEISTIEEGTFDCVDPVHRFPRIYLAKNKLRTIPPDIDSRIQITIHNNPIVCDCKLAIPHNFNDRHAKCEEPSSLKDTYIMNLKGKITQCECVELETTGCPPPNIVHGQVDPNCAVEVGGTVYLLCDEGYEIRGPGELQCRADGSYEEVPICKRKPTMCPVPEIENASLSPTEPVIEGESYLVECNQGYERVGDEELICGDDGETFGITNGDHPVCRNIAEPCEIPRIRNGWITIDENEVVFAYGEEAFVICNQPHYGPVQTRVTCIGNNRWNPPIPSCTWQGPTCDFPTVANGVVSPQMDVVIPWTVLTVVCKEGHSIEGPSQVQCLNNGQFNNPMPRCVFKGDHEPDPSVKECGQRSSSILTQHRIYGGSGVVPGEYPWNVLIKLSRGRVCGGSIISREWVLTAGVCLLSNIYRTCNNREEPGCRLMDPRDVISITAGVHNKDEEDGTWQVRTALEVSQHPYFTSQSTYIDYDVGLIKVNKPFVYNDRVNRVCLPKDGMVHLVGNLDLHVTGWGKTDTTLSSDVLQKISVPYVSREICNAEISYDGAITDTMFCAGYQKGMKDACQGDSGGPLVYRGPNGTFVQGGIISWGRQCAVENFYGVYTNLAYFYTWIMGYIGEN